MARWLLIWLRNRVVVALGFALVVAFLWIVTGLVMRHMSYGLALAVLSIGTLALLGGISSNRRLARWTERLFAAERNAARRPRY